MTKLMFSFFILWSCFIFGVSATEFETVGKLDSFDLNPKTYELRHGISYYIPSSYESNNKKSYQVLILMHGGGMSTRSYESAKEVAEMYLKDFIDYSEDNETIIIAPSTSVGWSFITRVLMTEVIEILKDKLKVDSNKIILFGHSMGAMGITREAHWLADKTSAIFPTAGGMQDHFREKEHYLNTYFNVPFLHINGEHDHFWEFKPNSIDVEKRIKALEQKYNNKSQYKLFFHDGGHNYRLKQVYEELDKLYGKSRNLYQARIYPLFGHLKRIDNRYGPDTEFTFKRYFWLAVNFKERLEEFHLNGKAEILNNNIKINIETNRLKFLDIYLSSKMIDFQKLIKVIVNGKLVTEVKLKPSETIKAELIKKYNDKNFIFENKIRLNF